MGVGMRCRTRRAGAVLLGGPTVRVETGVLLLLLLLVMMMLVRSRRRRSRREGVVHLLAKVACRRGDTSVRSGREMVDEASLGIDEHLVISPLGELGVVGVKVRGLLLWKCHLLVEKVGIERRGCDGRRPRAGWLLWGRRLARERLGWVQRLLAGPLVRTVLGGDVVLLVVVVVHLEVGHDNGHEIDRPPRR
jgi:hypothetical protein